MKFHRASKPVASPPRETGRGEGWGAGERPGPAVLPHPQPLPALRGGEYHAAHDAGAVHGWRCGLAAGLLLATIAALVRNLDLPGIVFAAILAALGLAIFIADWLMVWRADMARAFAEGTPDEGFFHHPGSAS